MARRWRKRSDLLDLRAEGAARGSGMIRFIWEDDDGLERSSTHAAGENSEMAFVSLMMAGKKNLRWEAEDVLPKRLT